MQIGNRKELDRAREYLRDQFDSVWINYEGRDDSACRRAMRCAAALDKPRAFHASPNWTIFPGGRMCGQHNAIILA